MIQKTTIFALSSGAGRAGIAVVRVSGPSAASVFKSLGLSVPSARRAVARRLSLPSGDIIDEAMLLWLPGPASATGEDMAELHLHGSPAIVSRVLRHLGSIGCVMAEPGEFTRRAFDNERIDLLQVEGLADVLAADTESQRRLAMRQFLGEASSTYERWRGDVMQALALVEAAIDFSDEGDVAEKAFVKASAVMGQLISEFERALAGAEHVAAIRRGLRVVLAGPPNAGKSSLLNWLAGRDAAIVSPIAGTTRDVVEAHVVLEGVPLLIADTAGLRETADDEIEREGMQRSLRAVEAADILVWIESADQMQPTVIARVPDLLVVNKIDLASALPRGRKIWPVSVRTGQGLGAVKSALEELIRHRNQFAENAVVVRERHHVAVEAALTLLRSAASSQSQGLEFVAEDMRKAAKALAGVTGRIDVEDLLGKIFQDFCIGK